MRKEVWSWTVRIAKRFVQAISATCPYVREHFHTQQKLGMVSLSITGEHFVTFRWLSMIFEGILMFKMRPKIHIGSFAACAVLGLAILCVPRTASAQATWYAEGCLPDNWMSLPLPSTYHMPDLEPVVWAPGHTYTVTIPGAIPVYDGYGY